MAKRSPRDPATELMLVVLDGSFVGKGWQGATLSGSLRGITAAEALWKPSPKRKCIWEQTLHAAYWKHRVIAILSPGREGEFDRSPANWPRPGADEKAWKRDRALLTDIHKRLTAVVASLNPALTHEKIPGRKYTHGFLVAGAAAHDAYHLGQIQLLKRLMRNEAD